VALGVSITMFVGGIGLEIVTVNVSSGSTFVSPSIMTVVVFVRSDGSPLKITVPLAAE
jgi:hypothetical protein